MKKIIASLTIEVSTKHFWQFSYDLYGIQSSALFACTIQCLAVICQVKIRNTLLTAPLTHA